MVTKENKDTTAKPVVEEKKKPQENFGLHFLSNIKIIDKDSGAVLLHTRCD